MTGCREFSFGVKPYAQHIPINEPYFDEYMYVSHLCRPILPEGYRSLSSWGVNLVHSHPPHQKHHHRHPAYGPQQRCGMHVDIGVLLFVVFATLSIILPWVTELILVFFFLVFFFFMSRCCCWFSIFRYPPPPSSSPPSYQIQTYVRTSAEEEAYMQQPKVGFELVNPPCWSDEMRSCRIDWPWR